MATKLKKRIIAATNIKRALAEGKKKTSRCWPGYEPVPGKKPGTKGSCRKIKD
jgi:hypothetical protein